MAHRVPEPPKPYFACQMKADTRFAAHFDFIGDFSCHYGVFAGCGTGLPFAQPQGADGAMLTAACCQVNPTRSGNGLAEATDPRSAR